MTSMTDRLARSRAMWQHVGDERPPFAAKPKANQESVWDYPRPPRCELDPREVIVRAGTAEIARTRRAVRVLETASPPTFYLPPEDIQLALLERAPGRSGCEWKGVAGYWSVVTPALRVDAVGWSYDDPYPEFAAIRGFISFYPAQLECFVDGVRVQPQPGRFYGGWVTPEIAGPFKGEPGSEGW